MTKRKNNKANPPARKAVRIERELAGYWASLYREAQKRPDKLIWVHRETGIAIPADDVESLRGTGQLSFALKADDTERLVCLLENFEKHGTFEFMPNQDLIDMVIGLGFSYLKKMKTKNNIAMLEKKHKLSNSSIRRPLARIRARLSPVVKIKERRQEREMENNRELERFSRIGHF